MESLNEHYTNQVLVPWVLVMIVVMAVAMGSVLFLILTQVWRAVVCMASLLAQATLRVTTVLLVWAL